MNFSRKIDGQSWEVVYDRATRDNGSLLFPEKLSKDFLDAQRKLQGSYIYAHQYQNEIIPGDDQDFKKEWIKYYTDPPKVKNTFAFIDPAISLENHADYTALVVVDVDHEGTWYLKVAKRMRITATETIKLIFAVHKNFKPSVIGIEIVAYQEALLHFLDQEFKRTGTFIPVHGVKRSPDKSKTMRIRSLVPRFEWGRILVKHGLNDFEDEYLKFPRGQYVDIMDALSSIEEIAYAPQLKQKEANGIGPNHPDYEKRYIERLLKEKARAQKGMAEEP